MSVDFLFLFCVKPQLFSNTLENEKRRYLMNHLFMKEHIMKCKFGQYLFSLLLFNFFEKKSFSVRARAPEREEVLKGF